jgi:N-acetylglucosaminyldiphosphoundecaprenol N-acetyl-beta-D-mannosaminyltransferase
MKNRVPVVFGVPIEGEGLETLLNRVRNTPEKKAVWIVTANPEILLAAKEDPVYAATIKRADVRCIDGFGLRLMLSLTGRQANRVTGVALSEALIRLSVEKGWRVAFVGGDDPEVGMRAASLWKKRFPKFDVLVEHGGKVGTDAEIDEAGQEALFRLRSFAPDIVLAAFGHPKQERWIERQRQFFPEARCFVGIGGTLDYWAGSVRRAPSFLQTVGLEWLWRLMVEPRRWKRIWRAVVVFPLAFFFKR